MANPPRRESGTGQRRVSDRPRAVTGGQGANRAATATTPGRPATAATPGTNRAATSTTPGRRTISDRQRGDITGTRSNLTPVKGRGGARPRGMRLRMKFMLVLSGITAAAMIVLGLTMSAKANKFLFSQKQHDGIEVARMAAEIGSVLTDQLR